MTDTDIIKALECCREANNCSQCEYEPTEYQKGTIGCCNELMENAIDLINRQKAEIERLERHTEMYHEVRAEAVKEFAERLKEIYSMEIDGYYGEVVFTCDIDDLVKEMVGEGK